MSSGKLKVENSKIEGERRKKLITVFLKRSPQSASEQSRRLAEAIARDTRPDRKNANWKREIELSAEFLSRHLIVCEYVNNDK